MILQPDYTEKENYKIMIKDSTELLAEENSRLQKEMEMMRIMMGELEQTNGNLISATWRERDLKKQLKQAMDDLQNSKNLIEIQSKKISESINYSRRIQNAILPNEDLIKIDLPESFILYKPKDIVSGDFPYYYKDGSNIYLAAVDCTGHGVPGAMLSLIGYLTLTDVINNSKETNSAGVLTELHSKIVKTLKQDILTTEATDGMDIALCKINLATNKLQFSGAHRPLILIRDGQLTEYKAARLPIGGNQYKKNTTGYINHEIDIKNGDSIFFYSDGYQDQFGGPKKTKYSSSGIQKFLLENHHQGMNNLKESLNEEFSNWKGSEKQIDDILFIGVKF